jgi:N-methylhydantoinase A/acetophenone carboxylase
LARLLYKAEEELRKLHYHGRLFIGHNNGAVARVAKTRAVNTYNSGPAAGLAGAAMIARLYEAPGLISGDMGGTSFDLGCVKDGRPGFSLESDVEGFPVNVPMLEIKAIGAGGGSIASVKDGELRVGPRSAGALPGPACFGLGGVEPTVTDADLVLGLIDPDAFLGGGMRLDREKSRQAVADRVAGPLGVTVEEAALRIRRMIDRTMGRELGALKQRVFPEGDPIFLVYGGAGPGHCADVAREAGIRRIAITPFSSVFSAYSSAGMDVGHVYYRRVDLPVSPDMDPDGLGSMVAELRVLAERDMRGEGFAVDRMDTGLEWFFAAGGREVRLTTDGGEVKNLNLAAANARTELGLANGDGLMLASLGLRAAAPVPHFPMTSLPKMDRPPSGAVKGRRMVHLVSGGTPSEMPVYDRTKLGHGHSLDGPALIESDYTVVYLPEGWRMSVDSYNHLILEEG